MSSEEAAALDDRTADDGDLPATIHEHDEGDDDEDDDDEEEEGNGTAFPSELISIAGEWNVFTGRPLSFPPTVRRRGGR
jgi:hypothetical protein